MTSFCLTDDDGRRIFLNEIMFVYKKEKENRQYLLRQIDAHRFTYSLCTEQKHVATRERMEICLSHFRKTTFLCRE